MDETGVIGEEEEKNLDDAGRRNRERRAERDCISTLSSDLGDPHRKKS